MFLLKGFQKDGGLDSNQKESAIRRSFFGESRRTPPKEKRKNDRQVKPEFAKIEVEQKSQCSFTKPLGSDR